MDIPRGTELLVWYNDSYTSFFGIPLQCIAQDENCKKTLLIFLFPFFFCLLVALLCLLTMSFTMAGAHDSESEPFTLVK